MQTKVGVSQKDRMNICDSIFGEKGVINANDSIDFERKSKRVLVKAERIRIFWTILITNYNRPLRIMSMHHQKDQIRLVTGQITIAKA